MRGFLGFPYFLLFALSFVSSAAIGQNKLDFEDLQQFDYVENQYLSHGVKFDGAVATISSTGTSSGTIALRAGGRQTEYHWGALGLEFSSPQRRVAMRVGYPTNLSSPITAVLLGRAASGAEVARQSQLIGPESSGIIIPMEISTDTPSIVKVELAYPSGYREWIDDLEFDAGEVSRNDGNPPKVVIWTPSTSKTNTNRSVFALEGTIEEDTELADVRVRITGPGGESEYQIRYSGSVPHFTFGDTTSLFGTLARGTNEIEVHASDIFGNVGKDSITFFYSPPAPPRPSTVDLKIRAVEVTQGSHYPQKFSLTNYGRYYIWGGVPLVRGKDTVVRVYPDIKGATKPVVGVPCTLRAVRSRDGKKLEEIQPINGNITVDPSMDLDARRGQTNGSWNFILPHSWTLEERIDLYVHVNSSGVIDECPECGHYYDNERMLGSVYFENLPDLHLHLVRACIQRNQASNGNCPGSDIVSFADAVKMLTGSNSDLPTVWPVRTGGIDIVDLPNSPINFRGNFSANGAMTSDRMEGFLDKLHLDWAMSQITAIGFGDYRDVVKKGYDSLVRGYVNHILVGVVPPPVTKTLGIAKRNRPVSVIKLGLTNTTSDGRYVDSLEIAAHEFGHTFGIRHAPSVRDANGNALSPCDDADDENSWYPHYAPYPRSSIGHWGVRIGAGPSIRLFNPNTTYDFMSYCSPEWTSPYTIGRITRRMDKGPVNRAPVNQTRRQVYATTEESPKQEYLLVSGAIAGETIELNPVYAFRAPPIVIEPKACGKHSVVLLDNDENVVVRQAFELDEVSDGENERRTFFVAVPSHPKLAMLRIEANGVILTSRERSANAPEVKLISPVGGESWAPEAPALVRWRADDKDGDPLSFTVLYSQDDGVSWHTLATQYEDMQMSLDTGILPGSDSARVRVLASDGLSTGMDESDNPFSVAGHPPELVLLKPTRGASIPHDQPVILQAHGSDREDGALHGASIQWFAGDEPIATGRRADAHLTTGTHEITVIAVDSDGNRIRRSVVVDVAPAPVQIDLEARSEKICQATSHLLDLRWQVTTIENQEIEASQIKLRVPDKNLQFVDQQVPPSGTLTIPVHLRSGGKVKAEVEAVNLRGDRMQVQEEIILHACP